MKRLIKLLEALALAAALIVLIGLIAIERTVHQKLPSILASTQTAAQKFALASDSLSDAAHKQDLYLDQTSRELNKTVSDAHDLLIHTDLALNGHNGRGGLLPSASALVSDQHLRLDVIEVRAQRALADLDSAEQQVRPILASLNQATRSAASASNSLARTAGNPLIAESLEHLDFALTESDATIANLQAISASGNRDAAMIETRLRRALKPASMLKTALLHALGIVAPAAEISASLH